ncbi:protein phosphatase 1 regulatory subunit 12A isoform X1 [Microplitis demolitor]|uniref:protein phosphatase 1 regulatory subunit 12A isoform X1 n=1 Tax=Microplitis demolitor TaxID=69319 RepID=UPI0004CD07B2|nr:protein phosphatase 1 regulatory subunit 12A isoform X1 [Microplitis demolitor]XP_008560017.1 protein phosphatase 1 regulatory subunit 12A isoform X1 [Microplitis demolitor]
MSLETRSNSALFKRAEQLKRWEQSETNREPAQPRQIARKIKFSADCVFLAACAAGDKEEVVRLLQKGADINTGNVDGLTALHQACIDDDLDMVEFLVEQGADINRGDNEGWTPLHATASCGFISIAKYLIEQGCNLAAVNNDGELALDIAESDEMEDLLQQHINKAGIDCDQARSEEERSMLSDAKAWKAGSPGKDAVHPRTGATALHVAAAKGYIKVMNILLQARCDVNAQDYDGWTPLHGAAHWGQLEACKLLVENYCDMDIKNFAGQTAFDVADTDILKALEELKKKQQIILKDHPLLNNQKQLPIPKKRMSPTIENTVVNEGLETFEEETPNKVIKVELEIQSDKDDTSADTNSDVEKKNRANKDDSGTLSPVTVPEINKLPNQAPILPPKQQTENTEEGTIPSWRRSGSFRSRIQENEPTNSVASTKENEDKEKSIKTPLISNKINQNTDSEVVLRRTHSFETDEKFYEQYLALRARIKASSCPTLHRCNPVTPTHTNTTTARSASLRETHRRKEVKLNLELSRVPQESNSSSPTSLTNKFLSSPVLPTSTTGSTPTSSTSTATTTTTSPVPGNQIRRSFVPPVRDEESETQRKAHAKRVRETRRSTQGVTLDEIKSAEQLVKKKQQQTNDTTSSTPQPAASLGQTASIIATITTATPTTVTTNKLPEETNLPERRPSWRLRVDNGSKFQLEDANNKSSDTTTAYIRRPSGGTGIPRPSSAPVDSIATSTADATVTLPLRRSLKSPEDKDQDKENDSRNAQATQAVIQRRRRPKRRSTGVVHVDMDEIDPDKQDTSAGGDYEESKTNHTESGNERSGRSSRLGSVTSLSSDISVTPSSRIKSSNSENGELDYKKLWEESQAENERLKEKLRRSDEQLKEVRGTLEKVQSTQSKLTLSEAEKRERRAMERKLSEMEEELKQLQKLKAENERLKAENRALTRVVSKLTNTTK